ncbi:hypothetical protein ACFWF3_17940 [Nocardia sp. NPDC060220]|uniref:hypothetical protein n=1 Tax=Nocardia sp. NPDC060220 TaxID=3347076 RepID=UPI0036486251
MTKTTIVACILMITAGVTGCSGFIHEGPTNQRIKDTTGLTVAEAGAIVERNFELIWPQKGPVEIANLTSPGTGCRTNPNSLMSEGPPWRPRYTMEEVNPPQEFIDRAMANLEAMTTRGFTLVPSQRPDNDPVNRLYRDSTGYTVASFRDTSVGPRKEVRFSMTASSPCAAE